MDMDLYDFGSDVAQTYEEECQYGEKIYISAQEDKCPEYYTNIYVKCNKCGASVEFHLPVN